MYVCIYIYIYVSNIFSPYIFFSETVTYLLRSKLLIASKSRGVSSTWNFKKCLSLPIFPKS